MAASVLNTPKAIEASIFVVRAFVKLRAVLATHRQLAAKLAELEKHLKNHDEQIQAIVEAIAELMTPPEESPKKIGFKLKEGKAKYGTGKE
jgi:hypothetical protein